MFYASGTSLGGPLLFGTLIETASSSNVFVGYASGAALMVGACITQAIRGVATKRQPLEPVATPRSARTCRNRISTKGMR